MLTRLRTINRHGLATLLFMLISACGEPTPDLNLQCQAGWNDTYSVSNKVYAVLAGKPYERYVALKSGSDRGDYSFYFVGQTQGTGVFLSADRSKITQQTVSIDELNNIFSQLPSSDDAIESYIGKNDVWSHAACDYLYIHTPAYSGKYRFIDHALLRSDTTQSARAGVELAAKFNAKFSELAQGSSELSPPTLSSIDSTALSPLEKQDLEGLLSRKSTKPIFYEIP